VETLVFGRAVQRALHPERTSSAAPIPMRRSSRDISPSSRLSAARSFRCATRARNWRNRDQCCLVSSISVANTLSEICENIGADWSEIVPALKLDARIGPQAYWRPVSHRRCNLERDLATVVALSERHHTDGGVVRA